MHYYNENDPFCVQWLRNLMAAGLIPEGHVDDRSIKEVQASDLAGYVQCHFFAGIAGWSEALRLCGLRDCDGIWTGSPPCQDSSVAIAIHGRRTGLRGMRSGLAHTWLDLVVKSKPRLVLFENVPGVKKWKAEITGRLEIAGYGVEVRNLSAACVGSPHPRRRVWIAADRDGARLEIARQKRPSAATEKPWPAPPRDVWKKDRSATGVLDDGASTRMAAIRSFGNAIVPQVAAEFIRAYLETRKDEG